MTENKQDKTYTLLNYLITPKGFSEIYHPHTISFVTCENPVTLDEKISCMYSNNLYDLKKLPSANIYHREYIRLKNEVGRHTRKDPINKIGVSNFEKLYAGILCDEDKKTEYWTFLIIYRA